MPFVSEAAVANDVLVEAPQETVAPTEVTGAEATPRPVRAIDAIAEEADSIDLSAELEPAAFETESPATIAASGIENPERCRSVEPAKRSGLVQTAQKARRSGPSFVRWATAASIGAVALLTLGRFSDTHVSAHAVLDPIRPVSPAETAPGAPLPPLQMAALASPPATAPLIAPPDAEAAPVPHGLAATIAPLAKERVVARDGIPVRRTAKARQPAPKSIPSDIAGASFQPAEPADDAHARLAGRRHALGRYEMRWGTARLHEDPNADSAQGPVWDFVASAGAR